MDSSRPSGVFLPDLTGPRRTIGRREFDFSRRVAVMAIVNRTPNSFHDRGRTFALGAAVAAVRQAVADGADVVDIGGVPFGLQGGEVTEDQELDRVVPVIEAVRADSDVVISVDTYRLEVARAAVAAGADIVNDTSALYDPAMADLAATTGATLIIAHSLARPPRTKVLRPRYGDVVAEVRDFLADRVALALRRGVPPEQIIIDPGHDLNKNTFHTLELTRRLEEVAALNLPLLVAVANKDFIGEALDVTQYERVEGTLATLTVCILKGARIVRVHEVTAAVRAVRMTEAILGWRKPVFVRHNLTYT
jgi:dihydropteroate synthase